MELKLSAFSIAAMKVYIHFFGMELEGKKKNHFLSLPINHPQNP